MESPHQFNTYSPFYSLIGAIFVPNLALSAGLTRLVLTPVVTGIFHALSLPLATVLVNSITRTQLIDS